MPNDLPNGEVLQREFVKQVKIYLIQYGLTAREICDKAQLSEAHWSNIQCGGKNLTLKVAARIAKACGMKAKLMMTK
jgi:transcriptional regulator with XRE-family HTH domain